MNGVGCQRAIRRLILDYADVLVAEIEQQGRRREIADVVLSPLTAPRDYYHILVQIRGVRSTSFGGAATNQAKPRRGAQYSCTVHVVDVALPAGAEEPYEEVHTDFRNLVDGLEALFCGSYWPGSATYGTYFAGLPLCIADPESDSEFSMLRGKTRDREVRVQNMDHNWTEPNSDQWTGILYSTLDFTLEEAII